MREGAPAVCVTLRTCEELGNVGGVRVRVVAAHHDHHIEAEGLDRVQHRLKVLGLLNLGAAAAWC